MHDLKKMTKTQLIEELIRVREAARNEPCGCCGITPKEWDETPPPEDCIDVGEYHGDPDCAPVPTFVPAGFEIEEADPDEDE